jgi:hypothetical protein
MIWLEEEICDARESILEEEDSENAFIERKEWIIIADNNRY